MQNGARSTEKPHLFGSDSPTQRQDSPALLASGNSEQARPEQSAHSVAGARQRQARSRNRKVQHERRLYADVNRRPDVLWQENPPRVLAYLARAVHEYGWIPLNPFNWRNVKATVFASWLLHFQTVCLLVWTAIIHTTGLGASKADMQAFSKVWGTVYSGAVLNFATVVVFILGLFVTVVINRWWSIRTAHTKLSSSVTDLAMIVANTIRDTNSSSSHSVNRARTEIIRLLNLAHILVCIAADGQKQAFAKRKGLKFYFKSFVRIWYPSYGRLPAADGFSQNQMGTLGYYALSEEGLVNEDEWEQILFSEQYGMPRYLTVMYWVEALLHQCRAAEHIVSPMQMLPSMLTKVSAIIDAANTIFTFIRSQTPYPYVHLVSFTVHFYLFFWATYMGALLYGGVPDGFVTQAADTIFLGAGTTVREARAALRENEEVRLTAREPTQLDGPFSVMWVYVSVAFANVIFQGLLNIHSLLDNPFGDHCCNFPLRAQITEVLNATRTLLTRADVLPNFFSDVFDNKDVNTSFHAAGSGMAPGPPSVISHITQIPEDAEISDMERMLANESDSQHTTTVTHPGLSSQMRPSEDFDASPTGPARHVTFPDVALAHPSAQQAFPKAYSSNQLALAPDMPSADTQASLHSARTESGLRQACDRGPGHRRSRSHSRAEEVFRARSMRHTVTSAYSPRAKPHYSGRMSRDLDSMRSGRQPDMLKRITHTFGLGRLSKQAGVKSPRSHDASSRGSSRAGSLSPGRCGATPGSAQNEARFVQLGNERRGPFQSSTNDSAAVPRPNPATGNGGSGPRTASGPIPAKPGGQHPAGDPRATQSSHDARRDNNSDSLDRDDDVRCSGPAQRSFRLTSSAPYGSPPEDGVAMQGEDAGFGSLVVTDALQLSRHDHPRVSARPGLLSADASACPSGSRRASADDRIQTRDSAPRFTNDSATGGNRATLAAPARAMPVSRFADSGSSDSNEAEGVAQSVPNALSPREHRKAVPAPARSISDSFMAHKIPGFDAASAPTQSPFRAQSSGANSIKSEVGASGDGLWEHARDSSDDAAQSSADRQHRPHSKPGLGPPDSTLHHSPTAGVVSTYASARLARDSSTKTRFWPFGRNTGTDRLASSSLTRGSRPWSRPAPQGSAAPSEASAHSSAYQSSSRAPRQLGAQKLLNPNVQMNDEDLVFLRQAPGLQSALSGGFTAPAAPPTAPSNAGGVPAQMWATAKATSGSRSAREPGAGRAPPTKPESNPAKDVCGQEPHDEARPAVTNLRHKSINPMKPRPGDAGSPPSPTGQPKADVGSATTRGQAEAAAGAQMADAAAAEQQDVDDMVDAGEQDIAVTG